MGARAPPPPPPRRAPWGGARGGARPVRYGVRPAQFPFVRDALLERENTYGLLETRMHEQFPNVKFTVRNLSWSGETPKGWSRASFDGPEKGWERLKEQIAEVKPTVAILGFGSQGHAHGQNLRDSGVKVIVANRKDSANGRLATEHGFDPMSV